jgi:hypothetical protein
MAQSAAIEIRNAYKARKSGLKFDVMVGLQGFVLSWVSENEKWLL